MADFRQFLTIFCWNSLILGQCVLGGGREGRGGGVCIRGWAGGARGGVGGGKSLIKEEIRHKE